jgi:hypothetical protein
MDFATATLSRYKSWYHSLKAVSNKGICPTYTCSSIYVKQIHHSASFGTHRMCGLLLQ